MAMKVVHLIGGGDVGGAKTHVFSLIRELSRDIKVTLVSFLEGPFSQEAAELGIDVRVIHTGHIFKDLKVLTQMVRQEGFELIHCHGARGNIMGVLLKMKLGLPIVTTVHSDYRLDYLGRPARHLTVGLANTLALRLIDSHIGVSDVITELLIDRGFPPERMYTIYNCLDFSGELPPVDREEFLASCGLQVNPGDVVAGIAARLSPVKDIPTLLRAMAGAIKQCPNLKLVIAGDGEEMEPLKRLSGQLGISQNVCFAGWVARMDDFYRCIDINLLTSLSETFPYVLTEGARMSLATISTRVGGVPALIDHGVSGLLFEPGDVAALTGHLVTLAQDESLRREMGAHLYAKARRDFSLESMIARQMEIYQIILRRAARPKQKRDGVTICGAYGRGNLGDEAILEAIIAQMRQIDPDMPVRVLSRAPRNTRKAYRVQVLYTFNPISIIRNMRRSKLYINGGGSLIQDVTSSRSLWFYLWTLWLGRRSGNKVHMYGCGIGPVTRPFNRRLTARVLSRNVDAITLREDDSQKVLEDMGIRLPLTVLSADPAVRLTPAGADAVDSALVSQGIDPEGKYICFALRRWRGFDRIAPILAAGADYAYEKHGLTPLFLPIERLQDAGAAQAVRERVHAPCHVLDSLDSARLVIGAMGRMKTVLAMRLHALVFASSQGVPLIGVAYDAKVTAFLRYIGQDLCSDIDTLNEEQLKGFIDRAVFRADDYDALSEALARLKEIERRNGETARALLGESNIQGGKD